LSCMDATLAPTPVPSTQASMPQSDLCSRLQEDIKTCPDFGKIYAWLSSNDPRARAYRTKYDIMDGILRFRTSKNDAYRICVPRSLRATLLHEFHDTPVSGHFGVDKTYSNLSRDYYWRPMHRDVTAYVHSCVACQHSKNATQAPAGLAQPLPIPTEPGQVYSLDYVLGLPPDSAGHNCCVVAVDLCSKRVS
jgi:hypothetical protein